MPIYNTDDIIDSRDVIDRITDLLALIADAEELDSVEPATDEERGELLALQSLAEQASGTSDWEHGEALIRDSYFQTYARELADELDSAPAQTWPYQHVDWEAAANELKQDYTPVEFAGVTYWIRW
jgi:antirestriction protein